MGYDTVQFGSYWGEYEERLWAMATCSLVVTGGEYEERLVDYDTVQFGSYWGEYADRLVGYGDVQFGSYRMSRGTCCLLQGEGIRQ